MSSGSSLRRIPCSSCARASPINRRAKRLNTSAAASASPARSRAISAAKASGAVIGIHDERGWLCKEPRLSTTSTRVASNCSRIYCQSGVSETEHAAPASAPLGTCWRCVLGLAATAQHFWPPSSRFPDVPGREEYTDEEEAIDTRRASPLRARLHPEVCVMSWTRSHAGRAAPSIRRQARRLFQPKLEALEDRTVPSAYTFTKIVEFPSTSGIQVSEAAINNLGQAVF